MICWYHVPLFGLLAGLAGCESSTGNDELQHYLQNFNGEPGVRIDPLPIRLPSSVFTYNAEALRNPFEPIIQAPFSHWRPSSPGMRPDETRIRQSLENFDLEQLVMVGTLANRSGAFALLQVEGLVYRVKVGDYLGRHNGRVEAVSAMHIEVLEVKSDGQGAWLQRSLTISLKQQS